MQNTLDKLFFPVLMLQLFAAPNTNVTTDGDLSGEMKTFYSDYLIDVAEPKLVHDQFGQKHPIPKGGGKTIEFRKYNPLGKLLTPITEGVTPDGQKLSMSTQEATVSQYGGYVTISDILTLTAIDNNLTMALKLLGNQAGRTLDTITREVLAAGTNVLYAGNKTARFLLDEDDKLSVDAIKRAVRFLKVQLAEPIGDSYVAIVHPDNAFDFTADPAWRDVRTYCEPKDMYSGELGKMWGCRFVETTEAKVFHAADLSAAARTLTVGGTSYAAGTAANQAVAITETLTADDQAALVGRKVLINEHLYTVKAAAASAITLTEAVGGAKLTSAAYAVTINNASGYAAGSTAAMAIDETGVAAAIGAQVYDADGNVYTVKDIGVATITLLEPLKATLADNAVLTSVGVVKGAAVYPGEAAQDGRDVYATIVLGSDAYGVTELSGGGLQHIVKQLGSGGTSDPLNQRATAGWKATKVAERLVESYMVRVESVSTFQSGSN